MSDLGRSSRLSAAAFAALALLGLSAVSAQALDRRPVAAITIYPGDVIREQMLVDAEYTQSTTSSVFASDHNALIGKVAKRTLLPGSPIPLNAIGVPRLISIGAMVRLVYEEGGLQISTYASALQNGAAGDVISVRNLESGVTLSGVVEGDGSIHVGPG